MLPDRVVNVDAVVISGPSMSDKRRLFHGLLREWTSEPMILATRVGADRIRDDHERLIDADGTDLVIVDGVTATHQDDIEDTDRTRYAAGPGNLTDIGTKFTDAVASRDGVHSAVGIDAISPLLMYASPEEVYRFTRLIVHQAQGNGWPVVGILEADSHNEQERHMVCEPFEVVIETRPPTDEAGPTYRVHTRQDISDWLPLAACAE